MSNSGRHGKAEDRRAAVEQAQIHFGALVQLGKQALGGIAVAVGLPAAAAGEVAALIFDEAHHIGERIAQKYADLMGKLCFAAQPPRHLPQQRFAVAIFREGIALLCQKRTDIFVRQHFAQTALAVHIDRTRRPFSPSRAFQPRTRSARSLQSLVS